MSRKNKKPARVAICGRRNAGKSTLLNAIFGKKRAITDRTPGLTRDIIEVEVRKHGLHFLLSDTPGLDIENPDELEDMALKNAMEHLRKMDLILLLMEGPSPVQYDFFLIDLLRKFAIPVIYVVNKVDSAERESDEMEEFYRIGLKDAIGVSAEGRRNLSTLLELMADKLPGLAESSREQKDLPQTKEISTVISDSADEDLRIAIVGRPNSGKSSLFNRLLQKELSLVSDVPGTTRDTVDSIFTYNGRPIRIVDTAGLRRSKFLKKEKHRVDFYSISRTLRAIKDSRIVIHLIDALEGITDFDKKISASIVKYKKPCLIAVNKWDAVSDKTEKSIEEYEDRIHFFFPHSENIPIIFCSAKSGQRLDKLIQACLQLDEKMKTRITTAKLNNLIRLWNGQLKATQARAKIFYATQAENEPPEFVFFVRDKKAFRGNFSAFFENKIRKEYSLEGIPISIHIREKSGNEND